MIPEKVFHQILALDDGWRVAGVDYVAKEGKVLSFQAVTRKDALLPSLLDRIFNP